MLLELAELGKYECFGENYDTVKNFLLSPTQISERHLTYSVISSIPLECYSIRKRDFYEYIDDITRK